MMMKLIEYLQYPFVRYALITGGLIALCASLLGVTLVLKRFSFIGDGLSHVAFGAMAVAAVMRLADGLLLALPVTIVCAVLLLKSGERAKVRGDAAVAMISTGALAFGYLLMNLFSSSSNLSGDVCSSLFGSTSILTLTAREVKLCAALSAVVCAAFVWFYHSVFAVTFDEPFARAVGTRADAVNLFVAVAAAVVIVLAMNLVGSLLVSALIVFPALSAMRLSNSFRGVTLCAVALSVVCALAGMIAAILAGTPVGSTIVAFDALAYGVCAAVGAMKGGASI